MKKNGLSVKLMFACLALVLFSGCASSVMKPTTPLAFNQPDQTLVTFLRPSYFGGAIQFGIWDSEKFVGVLSAGSSIQYLTEPGEHVFLARGENWSYVKADLASGKQYYIVGKVFPGVWKARVALDPIKIGDKDVASLDEWLAKLTPTVVIPEKFDDYVTPRVAQVKAAAELVDNGKVKYGVLVKEDGK